MIEFTRHLSVFNPIEFGRTRVDVIGCGATGSRIALSLAKLGVMNLHIWDFDKVEDHNLANQIYGMEHVGMFKGDALRSEIAHMTGEEVTFHNEKVDGTQSLGDIVFLLTDTMKSRKEIWNGLKFKMKTKLIIETRMGADSGRIYTVNPNRPTHVKPYEATLYDDTETEVSLCGTSISVGPTAELISSMAVWQMIRWFSLLNGADDDLENELLISTRPMMVLSRGF